MQETSPANASRKPILQQERAQILLRSSLPPDTRDERQAGLQRDRGFARDRWVWPPSEPHHVCLSIPRAPGLLFGLSQTAFLNNSQQLRILFVISPTLSRLADGAFQPFPHAESTSRACFGFEANSLPDSLALVKSNHKCQQL